MGAFTRQDKIYVQFQSEFKNKILHFLSAIKYKDIIIAT